MQADAASRHRYRMITLWLWIVALALMVTGAIPDFIAGAGLDTYLSLAGCALAVVGVVWTAVRLRSDA